MNEAEKKEDRRPLQQKDPKAWKARKERKQKAKDAVRKAAKKNGHRLGRWVGGGCCCKNLLKGGCEAIGRLTGVAPEDVARDATRTSCPVRS